MKSYSTKFIISLVAFIAVVGGIFAFVFKSESKVTSQPAPTIPSSPVSQAVNTPVDVPVAAKSTTKLSKYKNGTYTATGNYQSPSGLESIGVSLTIKGDIVTAASVTANASGGWSARYQQAFIGGYKSYVVGQSIDSISLGRISGSSLTPNGFNNALSQIKSQAQA